MSYQPIENYGIIGNMRIVALVGMNGSVDWDIVCLRELPAESSTWPELTRRADVSGTRYGRRHSTQSPILATRSGSI